MQRTPEELLAMGITPAAAFYMGLRAEGTPGAPAAAGGEGGGEGGAAAGGGEGAGSGEGGAGAEGGAAAAGGEGGAAAAGGGPDDGDPADWDKERAKRTIENLRRQEADRKREAAEEKKRADDLEREKMSEQEKKDADAKAANERADAADRRANEATLMATLATRDDVADAEIARDLLVSRGIKFGEDGKPIDLDDAVTALLEAKPVLKKSGETPAPGDGNGSGGAAPPPVANGAAGSGGQGPSPALTEDEVKAANEAGMSPERYAAMKDGQSLADWEAQKAKEKEAAGTS